MKAAHYAFWQLGDACPPKASIRTPRDLRPWILSLLLSIFSALVATAAPTIALQSPTRNVLAPGENLNLSVSATGTGSISYQWQRKGKAIAGATGTTLALTNSTYADSGWYLVDATDSTGTTRSNPIFVTVAPAKTQVRTWGGFFNGQTTVTLGTPTSLTDAISIAAGNNHMLAVRRDGTVVGWGANSLGQITIPAGLTNAVAVAAGRYHSAVLKDDGTVVVFGGANTYGQLNIPAGLSGVVAIAAGMTHTLALKKDGSVVAWGSNTIGETNVPSGSSDVVSISGGDNFSLVLKQTGNISGWGTNWAGQITGQSLNTAIQIAAAQVHAIALKSDGAVTAWGFVDGDLLAVPPDLTNVVSIAAGGRHSMALTAGGAVVAWGNNFTPLDSNVGDVFAIAAGEVFSAVLRDASNDTAPTISVQPAGQTLPELGSAAFSVTATGPKPLTYQWRKNGVNISGATTSEMKIRYLKLSDAGAYDAVVSNQIGSTTSSSVALTVMPIPTITQQSPSRNVLMPGQNLALNVIATGTGPLVYQWTHNGLPIAGATSNSLTLSSVTVRDNGYYLALITDTNGTRRSAPIFVSVAPRVTLLKGWGADFSGQTDVPVALSDAISVKCGALFSMALRKNGSVLVWGDPYASDFRTNPEGLSDVVAISAGAMHALALKADGTVIAWGHNFNGDTIVPPGLTDVVAIAAGDNHSLALRSDGTIVTWGLALTDQSILEAGLSDVVGIESQGGRSLAIKADGTAVEWWRYNGPFDIPVIPVGLTNLLRVVAGSSHVLALKRDNSMLAWGVNNYGQKDIPAYALGTVRSIAAGNDHSMVLFDDNRVLAWGRNDDGQCIVPNGWPNVVEIAAGGNTSLALRDATDDPPPQISVQPVSRNTVETRNVSFSVSATTTYGSLSYQWRKDGVNIVGAVASTLILNKVTMDSAGNYDVVVSNHAASTTSTSAVLSVHPQPVVTSPNLSRYVLSPGQDLSLAVTATGSGPLSYQWTRNGLPIAGATAGNLILSSLTPQDSGYYRAVVTDSNGPGFSKAIFVTVAPSVTKLVVIGNYIRPDFQGVSDAVAVSSGYGLSAALRRDGTVLIRGGQNLTFPGVTDAVAVAAGESYVLALKSDGTVVSWGSDSFGRATVPVGLSNVVAIAANWYQSLALKNDGTVVAWGGNSAGETSVPIGLNDVVAIAAGWVSSLALKSDGTVVGWGSFSPINSVSEFSDIVAVSALAGHVLALKGNGTVVAWGQNNWSQSNVPAGLAGVVAVAAGGNHSLALKNDGTVVSWGWDWYGQVTLPTGLNNVMGISAGSEFSVALVAAPTIASSPESLIRAVNQPAVFTVTLYGNGPFTYQWQKNGVNIAGATSNSYAIAGVAQDDAGTYTVVVTNYGGSVTSNAATLETFIAPPSSAVISISIE